MIAISWNKGSTHLAEINPGSRNQPLRDWMGGGGVILRKCEGAKACFLGSGVAEWKPNVHYKK